jgi:hypothetical protein
VRGIITNADIAMMYSQDFKLGPISKSYNAGKQTLHVINIIGIIVANYSN